MSKCVCIVPVTRIDSFNPAAQSIFNDDWTLSYEIDRDRVGANIIRNKLLSQAIDADYIRFADDDDLVLPHREIAIKELEDCDVVYFDYILNNSKCNFTGSLMTDAFISPAPWAFVAKATALRCITELFDPNLPTCQGGYAFFNMIKHGLKIKHIKHYAYHWLRRDDGVNSHPDHKKLLLKLQNQVYDFYRK